MTRSSALVASLLVLAACAKKEEVKITPEECLARVGALESAIRARAGFDAVYDAYKQVKAGLGSVTGDEEGRCEKAYAALRADTEVALRRDNLSVMGWILGFVAATILWGGCAACITLAIRLGRNKPPTEPLSAPDDAA